MQGMYMGMYSSERKGRGSEGFYLICKTGGPWCIGSFAAEFTSCRIVVCVACLSCDVISRGSDMSVLRILNFACTWHLESALCAGLRPTCRPGSLFWPRLLWLMVL